VRAPTSKVTKSAFGAVQSDLATDTEPCQPMLSSGGISPPSAPRLRWVEGSALIAEPEGPPSSLVLRIAGTHGDARDTRKNRTSPPETTCDPSGVGNPDGTIGSLPNPHVPTNRSSEHEDVSDIFSEGRWLDPLRHRHVWHFAESNLLDLVSHLLSLVLIGRTHPLGNELFELRHVRPAEKARGPPPETPKWTGQGRLPRARELR
jgi:hypothetical protein